MSFLSNIFSLGTSNNPAPAPVAAPIPPALETVPANPPTPIAPTDTSPLAAFSNVWETAPAEKTPEGMFANLDPAKVMESAKKVNFTGGVTPEQMQAIVGGGEGAIKAFTESMNLVAQSVYAQSALATTKIVEQALGKAQASYDERIPGMVKKFSSSESILAANPLMTNPAIQPLVGALQEQLMRKNPNATSSEIQQQVSDYFAALGTTFAPKPAVPKNQQGRQEQDWSSFF